MPAASPHGWRGRGTIPLSLLLLPGRIRSAAMAAFCGAAAGCGGDHVP